MEFFLPPGSPNVSDFIVTITGIIAGLIAYRQKSKDEVIANLQKHIAFLESQLKGKGDGK